VLAFVPPSPMFTPQPAQPGPRPTQTAWVKGDRFRRICDIFGWLGFTVWLLSIALWASISYELERRQAQ
jgi:hypothetical protein